MICFVCTRNHRYTFNGLRQFPGVPAFRVWSYHALFRAQRLPFATWVFCDLDRLGFWELEMAARLFRKLRDHGMRVLNDPARVAQRFGLLSRLHRAGINRFRVWRADDAGAVDAWPVFLRTESAHRGPLSDLLHTPRELDAAIADALEHGIPEKELMIVEYCAPPATDGVVRKLAMFRIGDRMVATLGVHDRGWNAKHGVQGAGNAQMYAEELGRIRDNTHAEAIRRVFDLAHIEYGRADFALVDGAPQIYEINTNPAIRRVTEHPFADRLRSNAEWERRCVEALEHLDAPSGRAIWLSRRRRPSLRRLFRDPYRHMP